VKGSGQALADAVNETFVKMDRKALARIWEKNYPTESGEREKAVLADLMAAREAGEEQKRPSVETMLHDLLPFDYVVHLHPALVNGLTCSRQGEAAMKELFPETGGMPAVWIPSANPGYILSLKVKEAANSFMARHGRPAAVIFLQNHGVFVGSDTVEGIKEIYRDIMERLEKRITRRPDFSVDGTALVPPGPTPRLLPELSRVLAKLGGSALFLRNREIAALIRDRASFEPVSSAFTPDHIVYAGSDPVYIGSSLAENPPALEEAWKNHVDKTGRPPKIAAVEGLGVFGVAASEKAAALALELFTDSVKVAAFTESFGGPLFMSQDQIDFINNWEVEAFRTSVAAKQ
jgi:rhamnose utilization protein RhaD (predicted bifunctional aldolase and dehydrogenase)